MLHNAQVVGFAEGTPILMADGKWKPIEQVKQGDWVMSFDPSVEDGQLEPRKVVDTYSTMYRDCIEVHSNGKVTVVAKDQLFFTPGAGWLPGYETKQVVDFSGTRQDVQVRRVRGGKFKVYDVTVDETHALVANDLRVHNKKKKKVVQAPQPVVTAGKPGKPVSVTTTYNGNTTTVVVNPSPGSSGQISVAYNGGINIKQNSVPGLPISDNTDYMPYTVLPYPGGSYAQDRARNAENIRSSICGEILSKGKDYRLTKADENQWETELTNMLTELQAIKGANIPPGQLRRAPMIYKDPTMIGDAIKMVNQIKKELKVGKKISTGLIKQNCDKLASMIARISGSAIVGGGIVRPIGRGEPFPLPTTCDPVWDSEQKRWLVPPCQPTPIVSTPPNSGTVSPEPGGYQTNRIYEGTASFSYMAEVENSCTFMYDEPGVPSNAGIRYYKHVDNASGKFYFDRVSSNNVCK